MMRKNRRTSRWNKLGVERLEERQCFSVTIMPLFNELYVDGDEADDHVIIEETNGGLQLSLVGLPWLQFQGIDHIHYYGGRGNDSLDFTWGLKRSIVLEADMGGGNDTFHTDINNANNAGYPTGFVSIVVLGGDGDDQIGGSIGVRGNTALYYDQGVVLIKFDAGAGSDQSVWSFGNLLGVSMQGSMGLGNDTYVAAIDSRVTGELPPGPCRITINGDAGDDSISALIGLLDLEGDDERGELDIDFAGGDGNDWLQTIAKNVKFAGLTSIDAQGGAGNDTVLLSTENVTISSRFVYGAGGGSGDDYVGLLDPTANDSTPSPVRNLILDRGQASIRLNGNSGNDRIIGQVAPQVRALSALDIIFGGDDGADLVSMLLYADHPTSQEGDLNLTALGGTGNDILFMLAKNQLASLPKRHYQVDGGDGIDYYYATPLVNFFNVEKKL